MSIINTINMINFIEWSLALGFDATPRPAADKLR